MSDYIKLEDAIRVIENVKLLTLRQEKIAIKNLKNLLTIDIVHCKECEHCLSEEIEETMPIYIYCDLWKGDTEWDSFCSYGERIEE